MNLKTHTVLTIIGSLLVAFLLPIFLQWYEQQTGISPFAAIFVVLVLSITNMFLLVIRWTDHIDNK